MPIKKTTTNRSSKFNLSFYSNLTLKLMVLYTLVTFVVDKAIDKCLDSISLHNPNGTWKCYYDLFGSATCTCNLFQNWETIYPQFHTYTSTIPLSISNKLHHNQWVLKLKTTSKSCSIQCFFSKNTSTIYSIVLAFPILLP